MDKDKNKKPNPIFAEYYSSAFTFVVLVFLMASVFVLKPVMDDIKAANAETDRSVRLARQNETYLR